MSILVYNVFTNKLDYTGTGNVVGPGSSTIGDIVVFGSTDGTVLVDSGVSFPIPVASGGTGDTSLLPFAVLTGGTTSTSPVQTVASLGSSGQVLTSNGAGALPSFQSNANGDVTGPASAVSGDIVTFNGTTGKLIQDSGVPFPIPVNKGGNGVATLTNHGVMLGQGTANVVVTAAGSNGQLLQSKGASADPTYTTSTYPSTNSQGDFIVGTAANSYGNLSPSSTIFGGFPTFNGTDAVWYDPRKYVFDYDDFITRIGSSFKLGWSSVAQIGGGLTMDNSIQDNARPGIVSANISTSANSAGGLTMSFGGSGNPYLFGGGRVIINFFVKIPVLSDATDTFTTRIGFINNSVGGAGTSGIYFAQNSGVNSGNWTITALNGGAGGATNTSNGTDTGWHRYTIDVNAGATSAAFLIDGVAVSASPLTSNIPTTQPNASAPTVSITRTAGSTNVRNVYIDLFTIWQELTVSR